MRETGAKPRQNARNRAKMRETAPKCAKPRQNARNRAKTYETAPKRTKPRQNVRNRAKAYETARKRAKPRQNARNRAKTYETAPKRTKPRQNARNRAKIRETAPKYESEKNKKSPRWMPGAFVWVGAWPYSGKRSWRRKSRMGRWRMPSGSRSGAGRSLERMMRGKLSSRKRRGRRSAARFSAVGMAKAVWM